MGPTEASPMVHSELSSELWALVLGENQLSLKEQLRASSTCKFARGSLAMLRRIHISCAAEANFRLLALFSSVHHATVQVTHECSAEALCAANPHEVLSEQAERLQSLRDEGPKHIIAYQFALIDEELSARLPFALAALAALETLTISHFHSQDSPIHVQRVMYRLMTGICDARRAGALQRLVHVEHGFFECLGGSELAAEEGMPRPEPLSCICHRLRQDWPVASLVCAACHGYGFHGDEGGDENDQNPDLIADAVRRGLDLNNPAHDAVCEDLLDGSPWVGYMDPRRCEKAVEAVDGLLNGNKPSYFDLVFLCRTSACLSNRYFVDEDEEDVERTLKFIQSMAALGGSPSYQLVQAATSGRLRAFYGTFAFDINMSDYEYADVDREMVLAAVSRAVGAFCTAAESKLQAS